LDEHSIRRAEGIITEGIIVARPIVIAIIIDGLAQVLCKTESVVQAVSDHIFVHGSGAEFRTRLLEVVPYFHIQTWYP
jgi:hypothetical protein